MWCPQGPNNIYNIRTLFKQCLIEDVIFESDTFHYQLIHWLLQTVIEMMGELIDSHSQKSKYVLTAKQSIWAIEQQ